ncbi:MAG: 30S ribosomal protein S9 [Candidatus Berkelbacteria bacterium]|nr:30S ribosomal protein S9 [Candidatus Berkelbacteria bacterium]
MKEYNFATGRRKTAIAQVRLKKGTGKVLDLKGNEITDSAQVFQANLPLKLISKENDFDITVRVNGGGRISQAEAIRLGVARAIAKIDPDYEKMMKKENFLSRDPREKERKKPGLRRARRAPQWAKR